MLIIRSVLESYIRTHSNLVEKLHHSLHLYVLVSDRQFSSMSKYTVCFVLFLLPLGLQALYLYFSVMHPAAETATATATAPMASAVPTHDNAAAASGAARLVSAAIMWMANLLFCLALLVAPAAAVHIRGEFSFLSTLPAALFVAITVVGLVILPLIVSACLPQRQIDWRITKAVTLCFVCIVTGALFVMNFPLAVAVASTVGIVLLPASASLPRSFAGRLLSLLVHVSMFAAAALFILTVSHLIGAGDAFPHQISHNWNVIEIATIGLGLLLHGDNRPVSISPLQLPVLAYFLLVGPCVVLAAQLVLRHAWALLTCPAADAARGKEKSE
jgi:hypothetical protein